MFAVPGTHRRLGTDGTRASQADPGRNIVRQVGARNLADTHCPHNGPVTAHPHPPGDFPTYPAGLRLAGRKVLVVGGGTVAQRRLPTLIAAGAEVHLVSPHVTPAIEGLVGSGEVAWEQRGFADRDLDEAWYVMAATDDIEVNERVSVLAEQQRIFCVRADDADEATAFTPAVGRRDGVTVAVMGSTAGDRNPRRSAGGPRRHSRRSARGRSGLAPSS